jgi:hypothetical protein
MAATAGVMSSEIIALIEKLHYACKSVATIDFAREEKKSVSVVACVAYLGPCIRSLSFSCGNLGHGMAEALSLFVFQ